MNILKQVFQHSIGEIWKITCSPHKPNLLSTCYSAFKGVNPQWFVQSSLISLPNLSGNLPDENEAIEVITTMDTQVLRLFIYRSN